MATGGAPRASVIKGSDEFYPFMCSPCSRKEIDVGAEVYCTQCEEYLCGKCHSDHNKFSKMATHTMLDRAQMEAQGPQRPQPTVLSPLTVPCDLHPGERYTLFCGRHNQVCCAVCSRVNHKSCDVRYILDVTKKAMQGPELNEFRRAVKETQARLEKVKQRRELDMQRMTTQKDTETKTIRASIQQMVTHLQTIEKTAVNDVSRKFNEYKTKIENDLTALGTIINALKSKLDKLEKANDDTEKFVHMKICEEDKSNAKKMIGKIEARVGEENLAFMIDWRVEESVKKLRSIGQLVQDYRYAVAPEGEHRVDTKKDKYVCNITGICQAEDGSLLMTDWTNTCLKRFDQTYRLIDRLKFDYYKPQVVCLISANQVAVSLPDSVVLVELKSTMSKSGSFKTTDRCFGIAHHADHLYIGCGGWKEKGDGPAHIAVYTISGTLVRKLETDSRGKLFSSSPVGVVMRRNDDVILVCDKGKGLVALRPDGQRLWTLTCKDLGVIDVTMISMDGHGQALVDSVSSNKVVLVSRDGRKLDEVLTARDGIKHPRALCYDQQQCRLIVGMYENNQVSVFKLA